MGKHSKGEFWIKTSRLWLAMGGLFLLSQGAFAQYTLEYSTNGSVITVTNYTGTPVNVTIPDFVTSIGDDAFYNCRGLTNLIIGDGVISIGEGAFFDCLNLTSVTMPDGVTSIGVAAFERCYILANIIIPDSVTNIEEYAFESCSALTSVTIPDGLNSIGTNAFAFCTNLTSISIPNSVTNIEAGAFGDCYSLTNITIPDSVISIGQGAFFDCLNLTSAYFEGNAPSTDSKVFAFDPTTAYYLYGTTGWESFSGSTGIPAVLLNPPLSTSTGNFGIQSNQFGFTVTGPTNTTVIVQASTDLLNWIAVQTNTLANGSIYFSDPAWTNYPSRFYRVQYPLP